MDFICIHPDHLLRNLRDFHNRLRFFLIIGQYRTVRKVKCEIHLRVFLDIGQIHRIRGHGEHTIRLRFRYGDTDLLRRGEGHQLTAALHLSRVGSTEFHFLLNV